MDWKRLAPIALPVRGRLLAAWRTAGLMDRTLAIATLVWLGWIAVYEQDWFLIAPVYGACAFLATALFLLTGRWRFSLATTIVLTLIVKAVSAFKYAIVAMNLHVYDIFFHASLAHAQFLLSAAPAIALSGAAMLAAALAFLSFMWRADTPTGRFRHRFVVALGGFAALGVGVQPIVGRNVDFINPRFFVLSSFVSSFGDLPDMMQQKGMLAVLPGAGKAIAAAAPPTCRPKETPPDIVLILDESAMPPGVWPNIAYPPDIRPMFESHDGAVRPLRVETFGGSTWLSDFSALTGLSTRDFGSARNFVMQFSTGRLQHTLPQYLRACGYATTVIYPSSGVFGGTGRFYSSIGFERVIDKSVHRAPDERQRDAFYFGQAQEAIAAARKRGDKRPQFIAVSTMAAHWPWDNRYQPDVALPGGRVDLNNDPEADEYLWRLRLAAKDRADFKRDLAQRFPDRRFLLVGYGDHQPALGILPFRALDVAYQGTAAQLDPASKPFETAWSVNGVNFTPSPTPTPPILEIAHLPTIVVAAAGLPLDRVYTQRMRLLERCEGLYATCADRGALLTYRRWLLDGGWMAQR